METVRRDFLRMRRGCRWIGWALCLCASLAVSARDDSVDMFLDVMHEDGTEPETGAEPAAPFLRCNKVRRVAGRLDFIDPVDASTCAYADSNHARTFFFLVFFSTTVILKRNYNGKEKLICEIACLKIHAALESMHLLTFQ